MVTIVPGDIVFSEKTKKDMEDVKVLPEKVVYNLFMQSASKKFERGTTWEIQKKIAKVSDKLETSPIELSDDQFDFLYETLRDGNLPPTFAIVPVVEYLENLKLANSKK